MVLGRESAPLPQSSGHVTQLLLAEAATRRQCLTEQEHGIRSPETWV